MIISRNNRFLKGRFCGLLIAAAMVALGAFTAQAASQNGVVPMNCNRGAVLKFFEENVYGARPKFEGFIPKAEVVKEEHIAEIGALRKTVAINTMTPIGEKTFKATAYFPEGKGRVPVFVMPGFRQPIREFDLAWKGKMSRWPVNDILARGCGTVSFDYNDVLKDDAHVFDGVVRPANGWGAISAWALAASRVADWLETEPLADTNRLAVVGLSRLGKTALWAGATDERFAMVCPTCSGLFGARMATRNLGGETIDQITSKFPHWFAPQCREKWCGKDWELPFDQHWLLGAVAPRLLAVGSAEDDWWACPSAEFCSWECSRGRFQELKCIGNTTYHVRHGGHGLTPVDWEEYIDFAKKHGWAERTTP